MRMGYWPGIVLLVTVAFFSATRDAEAAAADYFVINVVDASTQRGVPLVELRTTNDVSWWTDSNGIVAFEDPGLMDLEVYVHVRSPGYEYPADGLGYHGIKLKPTRGGRATIALKRLNIAERLYRITGEGIYRDSVVAGLPTPTRQPLLNGQVMGQDTVVAAPYRGKIYWFWGDTERVSYPLGHFGAAGATSELPGRGGLDPSRGVDLTYFVDKQGFSRPMCPQPDKGMRWIAGLFTVRDGEGKERLTARLAVMKSLDEALEWHLMVFNDEAGRFDSLQRWDVHEAHSSTHPFHAKVDDVDYCYVYPEYRVKAELKSLADLGAYEAFTCVAGDGRWRGAETTVDRDESGKIRYGWKRGADHLTSERMTQLQKTKKIDWSEHWIRLTDIETGAPLTRALDCVAWNAHRRRWIAFFADKVGEVWFAEADTPLGPWAFGRRIVTHGDYNFYNIAHHTFFDQQGGRLVYFEGTYTDSFSGAKSTTPRYNYNQLMYRLDLADARLQLPVAIYRVRESDGALRLRRGDQIVRTEDAARIEGLAFFALPPLYSSEGYTPIFAIEGKAGTKLSREAPVPGAPPLFLGLPLEPSRAEGTQPERNSQALMPLEQLCLVWKASEGVLVGDWHAQGEPAHSGF